MIAVMLGSPRFAHYFFTDTVGRGNGRRLAAYLTEQKLGTITTSPSEENRNTGLMLEVFVFTPNRDAITKWKADVNDVMVVENQLHAVWKAEYEKYRLDYTVWYTAGAGKRMITPQPQPPQKPAFKFI